jgi:hypothetical protein
MGVLVVVVVGRARSTALSNSYIIRLLKIARVWSPGDNDVRPSDPVVMAGIVAVGD